MFRSAFIFSLVAIVSAQIDISPLDVEDQPDHIVQQWCSAATDCLAARPAVAPTEIACQNGKCICGTPYELFASAICKGAGEPDPVVQVIVELTWDELKCADLPANFRATLIADLQKIYKTTDIDLRLKCGSVVASAVMKNVLVTTAAAVNIAEAIKNADIINIAGQVSKVDTYAGSGTCTLGEGQIASISIGGLCQPIVCVSGYTLAAGESVNEQDTCVREVIRGHPENDDELSAGAIGAVVVGVIGAVIIAVVVAYVVCTRNKDVEEEDLENLENKNGPDFD